MRDVMKAAELTGGGFYRHFSSKDQLVAEAIRAAFDRLLTMFDTVTEGMTGVEALRCQQSVPPEDVRSGTRRH